MPAQRIGPARRIGPAYRIGIVGVGKIVRDQHLPVLAASPDFDLRAAASRNATVDGVANFKTLDSLLAEGPQIDAVALCMPPQVRFSAALAALRAGKHVLLEKPPGASLGEIEILSAEAEARGVTLFASWHSRHAAAVEETAALLRRRRVTAARIAWKEDVRRWHPGQAWIWEPGGLGVFDPGINALSILTRILPQPLCVTAARLVFPANRQAPIAADLSLQDRQGTRVEAAFDWRQTGPQTWTITLQTDSGEILLSDGGSRLTLDGVVGEVGPNQEYAGLYARFAKLIAEGRSDSDARPLRLVADAFLLGARETCEAFED